jgi:hypothetical protein
VDTFSGNGSTTAFTLTSDPSTKNNTSVFISGVYQQKSTYSLSGTTLTFSTAPPSGTANIEVAYSTPLAIGTPSDGTVTNAKLAAGAVDNSKMASGAAVANIGYTPVNKAGDTMSGNLSLESAASTKLSVKVTDGGNDRNATLELLSSGNGGSIVELIYGDTDTTPGTKSPLVIKGYHDGALTERMRIDPSGNVFVGGATQNGANSPVYSKTNAKAWIRCDSAGGIYSSFNFSSVTKNSTGNQTANLTNAMSDNEYCVVHSISQGNGQGLVFVDGQTGPNLNSGNPGANTTSSLKWVTGNPSSSVAYDCNRISVAIFR